MIKLMNMVKAMNATKAIQGVLAVLTACALAFCVGCSPTGVGGASKGSSSASSSAPSANGTRLVDVTLSGGTGKASIESPAQVNVAADGTMTLTVVWSSSNYDKMVVDGVEYLPVNKSGNSEFVVPVVAFDKPVAVIGDTTAMSEAHEVDYELTVLRDSIVALDGGTDALTVDAEADAGMPWPWIVFIVCVVLSTVCIAITVALLRRYRKQTVA